MQADTWFLESSPLYSKRRTVGKPYWVLMWHPILLEEDQHVPRAALQHVKFVYKGM